MPIIMNPKMQTAKDWCEELGIDYNEAVEPRKMYTKEDFLLTCDLEAKDVKGTDSDGGVQEEKVKVVKRRRRKKT